MRAPDALLALAEEYVAGIELTSDLGAQRDSMRYGLEGGKRIRAVICLATAEAAGAEPEAALPAAGALELVHAFSLVHDDLPALDDDDERRGRPSAHKAFGEGIAILAGDALLVEAFRLVLSYPTLGCGARARGGNARDDRRAVPRHHRRRRRPGRAAPAQDGPAVCGIGGARASRRRRPVGRPDAVARIRRGARAGLPDRRRRARRRRLRGAARRRRGAPLAQDAAERAYAALDAIPADTSVLREIVESLVVRTAYSGGDGSARPSPG